MVCVSVWTLRDIICDFWDGPILDQKWTQMDANGRKWTQMDADGRKWTQNGPKSVHTLFFRFEP